jgi:hypothetical protein
MFCASMTMIASGPRTQNHPVGVLVVADAADQFLARRPHSIHDRVELFDLDSDVAQPRLVSL